MIIEKTHRIRIVWFAIRNFSFWFLFLFYFFLSSIFCPCSIIFIFRIRWIVIRIELFSFTRRFLVLAKSRVNIACQHLVTSVTHLPRVTVQVGSPSFTIHFMLKWYLELKSNKKCIRAGFTQWRTCSFLRVRSPGERDEDSEWSYIYRIGCLSLIKLISWIIF